jgi:flagellar biosynthetic protein FliP
VIGGLALLIGLDAHAASTATTTTATAIPSLTIAQVGQQSISLPLQILALMSAITLLPAILLSTTAFTRVVIVFGLLRQALGTGQTPSNQILIGLSLFLTALIMAPVAEQAWTNGIAPYMDGKLDFNGAWQGIVTPLRAFMLAQVRDNDLLTFAGLSGAGSFASPADVPLPTLVASFLTSELKTAFEIGFLLYIPFVIIDADLRTVQDSAVRADRRLDADRRFARLELPSDLTMTPESALQILQSAMQLAMIVAAPLLIAALVVGILIGLLQAATQINEQSVAFVGKLGALAVVVFVAGPWMLGRLVEYAHDLIRNIPAIIG